MKKFMWFLATCLIYLCLATGFWLTGGDMHSETWYLAAAAPVFLFSAILYLIMKRMANGK